MLKMLKRYTSATNNETYDKIFFYLRTPEFYGPVFTTYIHLGVDVVAPFLYYRHAQIGIRLSPWKRFFNRWHREVTSNCNQVLARLPTADGYSASNEPLRMLADLGSYSLTQLRRAARKLSQRLFGRSMFYKAGVGAVDAPDFMSRIKQSTLFADCLVTLKRANFLKADLEPSSIADHHAGRLMTLALVIEALDEKSKGTAAAQTISRKVGHLS
jgi:hypothetical protein